MCVVCTHASRTAAGTGLAVLAQVRLHKVLGDSQSWVVVSGEERGQEPAPFPGRALGWSGGFGLSGPRLVLPGWGAAHMSPPALEAARGPAWAEVPCGPSSASRGPGNIRAWAPGSGRTAGRLCSPSPGSPRLQACPWQPTTGSVEKVRLLGPSGQAPERSGMKAGQQGPVSRAESLRSMHSLHLAMFSTSAWSVSSCCSPSMSSSALW